MSRLIVIFVLSITAAFSAFATPTITFEEQAVVAAVTPGASTAWYAVVHEWDGYRLRVVDRATVYTDTDNDGVIRLTLDEPLFPDAVWMVVDLSTGDYAVAAPAGIPLHRLTLPQEAMTWASGNTSAKLVRPQESMIVWLVRPGVGAWCAVIDDGTESDGDTALDGYVSAVADALQPVGSSPAAPTDFLDGDILAAVAPRTLQLADVRIDR
jgi:hypothetical protein